MNSDHAPPPTQLVIFGIAGDLARRKLLPGLFSLHLDGALPRQFSLVGLDRVEMSDDQLRERLREGISEFSRRKDFQEEQWSEFARRIEYWRADVTQLTDYQGLAERLQERAAAEGIQPQRLFYLAVPPALFGTIARPLGEADLAADRRRARIVVEKPLGYDLRTARELDETLRQSFQETQIFRIDHYLGKETVQNILAFRFASALFEPMWDRRYVDHVTITVAGCLRDPALGRDRR